MGTMLCVQDFRQQQVGQARPESWPVEKPRQQDSGYTNPEMRDVPPKPESDILVDGEYAFVEHDTISQAGPEMLPRYSQVMKSS